MLNWLVIYSFMGLLILFGVFVIINDKKKKHTVSK